MVAPPTMTAGMKGPWAGAVFGCALLLGLGVLWAIGFSAFEQTARQDAATPPAADAIVVLTGGADRVATALRLLQSNAAPLLLISGVGRGTDLQELARHVRLSPDEAARVTLGRVATTTLGNAEETSAWVHAHDVRRLIVVTAGYHMPRALIEMGRALPGVVLYPVPVRPPALRGGMERTTVRMLATEYDKYLAVRLGVTRRAEAEGS